MEAPSNPSVIVLTDTLLRHMHNGGFGDYCLCLTARYAKHLSDFMDRTNVQVYDEATGSAFLEEFCQTHHGTTHQRVKLFIARFNSIFRQEGFVSHRKLAVPAVLPENLGRLLFHYKEHCAQKGNRAATIRWYEHCCRSFLKLLADNGICDSGGITSATVSAAILRVTSVRSLPTIRTFLRFLAENEYLERGYSFLVPHVKPPRRRRRTSAFWPPGTRWRWTRRAWI